VNQTQNKDAVTARAPRSLSILVVEDHPDTRRAMEMFLQLLGHQTKLAADIKEALEMAAAGSRFDLLLSDLRLPDGNGWDLLRQLEEAGWRPKYAIAISGWGSETDLAKSKSVGFQAHLIKPLAPEALKMALERVATATSQGGFLKPTELQKSS
jgi:CheY-like chemotaxis protein